MQIDSQEIDPALEFEYVSGQGRQSFGELIGRFECQSTRVKAFLTGFLDQPYGTGARQTFDFFNAIADPVATLIYFHAGYWQSRDKSTFCFLAEKLCEVGFNVALVNYPLCPAVTIGQIVEITRGCVPAIMRASTCEDGQISKVILAGHSAGAHLAVELSMTDWATYDGSRPDIAGLVAISGIYDLEPLVSTSLNRNLRLSSEEARTLSPLWRARPGLAPALFVAGETETWSFLRQTESMHAVWAMAGNDSEIMTCNGDDHFSVLLQLTETKSELFRSCCALASIDI